MSFECSCASRRIVWQLVFAVAGVGPIAMAIKHNTTCLMCVIPILGPRFESEAIAI